jgi:L-lysine exporter family protein LysE/ArgO
MVFIGSIFLGTALILLQSPIFFELLRRIITKGFWSGAFLALGGFIAYFSILLIVFFGTYQVLLFESIKFLLFLIGGIVLMSIGVGAVRMKEEDVYNPRKKIIKRNHPILVGFSLGISSPFDVAIWVSVAVAQLGSYSSRSLAFINMIFFALGVMLVFFGLASLVYLARKHITVKNILWVSRSFGVILIGYSLYFLFQFLKLLIV